MKWILAWIFGPLLAWLFLLFVVHPIYKWIYGRRDRRWRDAELIELNRLVRRGR